MMKINLSALKANKKVQAALGVLILAGILWMAYLPYKMCVCEKEAVPAAVPAAPEAAAPEAKK